MDPTVTLSICLDIAQFENVLEKELGRAVVYLQAHDALPYRNVMLNYCLRNVGFVDRAARVTCYVKHNCGLSRALRLYYGQKFL